MKNFTNKNAKQLLSAAETIEQHDSDLKFKILLTDGTQIWAKLGQKFIDCGINISHWGSDDGFYFYCSQFEYVKPKKEKSVTDGIIHFQGQPADYVMD